MRDYTEFFKKELEPRKLNDYIMIIDGNNLMIRNFALIQATNTQGIPMGGMVGFLKSLGFLVRTLDPTRVLCVFDGKGSTINRRSIDPNYKGQRGLSRITSWGAFDNREQEQEALHGQIRRLHDYLRCLPLHIFSLDKLEADDVIAYLAKKASHSEKKVTIVSTDKDFLQLVDPHIQVYSPIKKIMYTPDNTGQEIGVCPKNYLTVKALLGDDSDNLPGVKGFGIKTLVKHFPELVDTPGITLDHIYDKCAEQMEKKPALARIVEAWDRVEMNHSLMNLIDTSLSQKEQEIIKDIMSTPLSPVQVATFLHFLEQDKVIGITGDTISWLGIFTELSTVK